MPIHDWSRVPSGLFHDFHQSWSIRIKDALNAGLLPQGLAALVEQKAGRVEPDVLAIELADQERLASDEFAGGVTTLNPPQTRIVRRTENERYSEKANRIVIRHHLGRIVAVIEIVSPGNKDGRAALRRFVEKTAEFLETGIHALVVDLLPPTARDSDEIHKAIWDEICDDEFVFPEGKDRILVSYQSGPEKVAWIEPVAVGDALPDMPLFLIDELNVPVPLEATYESTWNAIPHAIRSAVQSNAGD